MNINLYNVNSTEYSPKKLNFSKLRTNNTSFPSFSGITYIGSDTFETSEKSDKDDLKGIKKVLNPIKKVFDFVFPNQADQIEQREQRDIKILKKEFFDFIDTEETKFYSEYHSIEKIEDFEEGKSVLNGLLQNKMTGLSYDDFDAIFTKMKEDGISNKSLLELAKESNKFNRILYRQRNSSIKSFDNVDFNEINSLYFQQLDDLEEFKEKIESKLEEDDINIYKQPQMTLTTSDKSPQKISNKSMFKVIRAFQDVKLDDEPLIKDKYKKNDFYDFPLKFATASYNSRQAGNPYIKNEIPDMFKDIDEDELFALLDLLSFHIRNGSYVDFNSLPMIKTTFGDKHFKITALKRGYECYPVQIQRRDYKSVIMKTYYQKNNDYPYNVLFGPISFYGNIGIMYEANKAGVTDIPKLYMAAPTYTPVTVDNQKSFIGGWAIMEDANEKEKNFDLKMDDWIHQKGLKNFDENSGTYKNDCYVDAGFIQNKYSFNIYGFNGNPDIDRIYTMYIKGKTTEEILDYLKKHS